MHGVKQGLDPLKPGAKTTFQTFSQVRFPDASTMLLTSAAESSWMHFIHLIIMHGFPEARTAWLMGLLAELIAGTAMIPSNTIEDACFPSGKWTRELLLREASQTPKFTGLPVLG